MNRVGVIIAGVVVVAAVVGGAVYLNNSAEKKAVSQASTTQSTNNSQTNQENKVDTLQSTDEVVGTGDEAVAGKTVSVHYDGTLLDGTKFDSSRDRNQPFEFQLGGGQVIKGWDQGVVGMKVGGKRKLVIPASLAYGNQSPSSKIPANSTLVFEIELLGVK